MQCSRKGLVDNSLRRFGIASVAGLSVVTLSVVGLTLSEDSRTCTSPSKDSLLKSAAAKRAAQNFRGAADDFEAAIQLDPRDWTVWKARGEMRAGLGDFKGALMDFESGLSLKPLSPVLHNNRGGARLSLGDVRGALEDFSLATSLAPAYAEARINLALARGDLGDWKGAQGDYEMALVLLRESDPLRPIVSIRLREAKQRAGR